MKINYVVAFYITQNLKQTRNNFFAMIDIYFPVKCHLKQLEQLELPDVTNATFIINNEDPLIISEINRLVNETYNGKIPVEVKSRPNWGRSYAAWAFQIQNTLELDYDYYFLFEDDYCPVADKFYIPFLNQFNEKTAFTCQLYISDHPAAACSLISKNACKHIYDTYNEIFFGYNAFASNPYNDRYVVSQDIYPNVVNGVEFNVDWQVIYHKHFLNENYNIQDVSDVACNRFKLYLNIIDYNHHFKGKVDQSGLTLILPIY